MTQVDPLSSKLAVIDLTGPADSAQPVKKEKESIQHKPFELFKWKYIKSRGEVKESDDPRAQAKAQFNLLDPVESEHWPVHIKEREAGEEAAARNVCNPHDEGHYVLMKHFRRTTRTVLQQTALSDDEWGVVADNVLLFRTQIEYDKDKKSNVIEAHTRIYSPKNPGSVDVRLEYEDTREIEEEDDDDWFWSIEYRIHEKPTMYSEVTPKISTEREDDDHILCDEGWKVLIATGEYDVKPLRKAAYRKVTRRVDPGPEEMKRFHRVLFGADEGPGSLGSKIDPVETFRFLLSAVGIDVSVQPLQKREVLPTRPQEEYFDEQDVSNEYRIALDLEHDPWIAQRIRRLCGSDEPLAECDEGNESD